MSNDYPSESDLERIEAWAMEDLAGALDCVKELWHWPEFATHALTAHEGCVVHARSSNRYLRLATGGWLGNEDLVRAMRGNTMLWMICWRLSTRGGLHIFEYPRTVEA